MVDLGPSLLDQFNDMLGDDDFFQKYESLKELYAGGQPDENLAIIAFIRTQRARRLEQNQ